MTRKAGLDAERRACVRPLWPADHQDPAKPHLVIVLDEVDKLTVDEAGLATIEDLLSGIKNVLTMPGVHFLIVAGPDLHDRAIRDAARGNGVYESVFGWRMYVPCVWDAPDRLIADIIHAGAPADAGTVRSLVQYLRFKARGVPRRLLQEVNSLIAWQENCPGCGSAPRTSTGSSSTRGWSVSSATISRPASKNDCSLSPLTKIAGGSAAITSSTGCCKATASSSVPRSVREGEEASSTRCCASPAGTSIASSIIWPRKGF